MKKLLLLLPLLASLANAQTATTPLQASAQLSSVCTFTVNDTNFGVLDQTQTNLYTTGQVSVMCNRATPYSVVGNAYYPDTYYHLTGSGANGPNTEFIKYAINLFPDYRASGWWAPGNNSIRTDITGTGTGANTNHILYYKLWVNKSARVDNYSDTLTATLKF